MIDLYTFASANGYRAAIMLEETGLPYQAHAVDLAGGQHKTPEFLRINPLGLVPAIVDQDADEPVAIGETLAIALYVSEKSGGKLTPSTPGGRGRAWQWAAAGVSGFGPWLFGVYQARSLGAEGHAPLIQRYLDNVARNFAAMDQTLADSRYIAGDEFSFADVLLAPFAIMSAPQAGIDLSPHLNLCRWRDEVAARPAVIRGMSVPHPR